MIFAIMGHFESIMIILDQLWSFWYSFVCNIFNLLGQWLTRRPLCSNFSLLSRMVFSKLNWAILPWQRHSDLALFVIQSGATYAPDCIAGNFIQDGVRQVSNIANKLRRTPEQIWSSWAWEMVSRLRLHQNDIVVENR